MPIFEYHCSKCKHAQDEVVKLSEIDTIKFKCEKCGRKMIKVLSAATVNIPWGSRSTNMIH